MAYRDPSRPRPIWPYAVAAVVLGLGVVGFFVVRDLIAFGRPIPEFPLLADDPDPSLRGTVAYYAVVADPKTQPTGGCVRVVAAAGVPSRDVLCFEADDDDTGPQLAFLPDGRLEVTMFSWPLDQPLVASWQKIVDVRTGEMEDVPDDQLPGAPVPPGATTTPAGDRIAATSQGNHAELVLTDADGVSRRLWSADVSPEYSMRVIWAPGWEWILAYDGRLLSVSIGDPAQVRVLVEEPTAWGGFGSTDPPLAVFAVTDADLLEGED